MVKTSKETMKTDEIKVLDVLERHAKENIDKLAKKCGFSHQKFARIIKHLETEKRIWGYSAVTSSRRTGSQRIYLACKKKNSTLR